MNAKILLRTIKDLDGLETELGNKSIPFRIFEDKMEAKIEYSDIDIFGEVIKKHLNALCNYVNVKFPERQLNVIIFPEKNFIVNSKQTDRNAKEWALSVGLPQPETEWTTFY